MNNLELISKDTHSNKYWRRPDDYNFTKNESFCPITLSEVPAAILSLPIGFLKNAEDFQLGALIGLKANKNLAIDSSGKWLLSYVPGYYRAYPFALAKNSEGTFSLCIRSNEDFVTSVSSDEAFFTQEGQPTKTINEILNLLSSLASSEEKTTAACRILSDLELIEPWPISIFDGENTKNIEGVFRVSEKKLAALSAENLLHLRDNDALTLAYGQLFSMQNLQRLGERLLISEPLTNAPKELDFDGVFEQEHGSINFSNL